MDRLFPGAGTRHQILSYSLGYSTTKGHDIGCRVMACYLVGVAGFEPAASSSRTKRAAKLRHTPPASSGAWTPGAADFPGTSGSLADPRHQREQRGFWPAGEPDRGPR